MANGVLVDLTRCIGCGACSVACKLWNDIPFAADKPMSGATAKLADQNWTVVKAELPQQDGQTVQRFVKQQCLHCEQPACASACFSKALERRPGGAVVYHPDLCVGCRYCMIACPFAIPKYEWNKTFPLVTKCQFCADRLADGDSPACTSVCPTGALRHGDREALLAAAWQTIRHDSRYIRHVYGEKEAGGTAWLYLSDIPFQELGFKTDVGQHPLPAATNTFLKYTPLLAAAWGVLLTGLYYYTKRRREQAADGQKEEA